MRYEKVCLWALLLPAPVLPISEAMADGSPYIGASIGSASISEDLFLITGSSFAYKFFGGYKLGENFSTEAGFVLFDEVVESVFFNTASIDAVADGRGFTVSGAVEFPIGAFTLTGKAGVLFWEADAGIDAIGTSSLDGSDLLVGLGARYRLSDRLSLTLDYEHYEFGDIDVDAAFLGLRATF